MKQKRAGKKKLTADDNPEVKRITRLQGGPIAEVWAIVFRDEKQNDYLANVVVPADPPAGVVGIPGALEKNYGGEAITTFTAEPAMVGRLEEIATVLRELGYKCNVVKFFILPQAELNIKTLHTRLHRIWDSDPQGTADDRIHLYSRATTALRELADLEGGKDTRREK